MLLLAICCLLSCCSWSAAAAAFEGKNMDAWLNLFVGAPESVGKPFPTEQEKQQAVLAFQRMGSSEYDYLINQVGSGQANPAIRYVFKAVGSNASPQIPKLILLLGKGTDPVYWEVAECLAGIGTDSIAPLMQALTNSDVKIRQGAAYALGRIGPPAKVAVPLLLERFKTETVDVQRPLISTLGFIGGYPDDVLPVLIEALGSKDEGIRGNAAFAIGNYPGHVDAIAPILFKLLNDKDGRIRNNAAGTLLRLDLGKLYLPQLITSASNPDVAVRCLIAQALGKQKASTNEVFPVLLKLTEDKDRYVRESAAVTINQMGYKPPVDVRRARSLNP